MRVRIHRGAREIGGSCIEVEASGKRLVLDVGRPLDAGFGEEIPLPDIPGLADGDDPTLLGLLISHGHQDHWGLFNQVAPTVPVYVGEGAASLLKEAMFFSRAGADLNPEGFLRHREPFELGPFQITPFLNDHNGFDTYSLLIEAGGKRLFYSADFQGHGRKAAIFQEMLRKPPENVDVMLMEGTNVRAAADEPDTAHQHPEMSEKEAEEEFVEIFKNTPGMALVTYSAQNIDRLVTIYRAAKRADRTLLLDLYTATIARATKRERIPQPGFPNLRVYVSERQRQLVRGAKQFHRVEEIEPHRIYREEISKQPRNFVMTFQMGMARELEKDACLEGASAVWSMWPGYLKDASGDRYKAFMDRLGIPFKIIHASGHAYLKELQKLAKKISPKRLVPIHSFAPERFAEHFENVERHADGEWWEV